MKANKNIHILPTDKPSRLQLTQEGVYYLLDNIGFYGTSKPQHIYITNDEEIKEENYAFALDTNIVFKVSKSDLKGIKSFTHLYKK